MFLDKTIMSLPIPAKGPKVTSLIWNGLDDLIVTGHDNGDIVQVTIYLSFKLNFLLLIHSFTQFFFFDYMHVK